MIVAWAATSQSGNVGPGVHVLIPSRVPRVIMINVWPQHPHNTRTARVEEKKFRVAGDIVDVAVHSVHTLTHTVVDAVFCERRCTTYTTRPIDDLNSR